MVEKSKIENIKFGVGLSNGGVSPTAGLEENAELIRFSERLGVFDAVFVSDMLYVSPETATWDAWTFIPYVSMVTRWIRLGTHVTCPHRRHPAVLAETVATADLITRGRVILGIGAGERLTLDPFNIPHDRQALRLREALEVIKMLWTQDEVNFRGTYFKLDNAHLPLRQRLVQKPHPPILVAANAHYTRRVAAELGDYWLSVMQTPELLKADLEEIRGVAEREFGRKGESIVPVYYSGGIWADPDVIHAQMSASRGMFTYGPWITERLGYKPVVLGKMEEQRVRLEDVPIEAVERTSICGTIDDVIGKLEKYIEAGVRYFIVGGNICSPHSLESWRHTLEVYAKEIIPSVSDYVG